MNRYFALVTKDEDSDYSAMFPDLPGCYTAGSDLNELAEMAEDALALHIAGLREEGMDVPPPCDEETMRGHIDRFTAENKSENVILIPVTLRPIKGKAVRVQITLDEYLLAEIDRLAAKTGETRSGFLATCARATFNSMNRF